MTTGTVGITVGTPAQVVDAIRHGSWPDAPETDPKIRTVLTPEEGIAQVQSGKLSGVVVPTPLAPPALILWQTEVLARCPDQPMAITALCPWDRAGAIGDLRLDLPTAIPCPSPPNS